MPVVSVSHLDTSFPEPLPCPAIQTDHQSFLAFRGRQQNTVLNQNRRRGSPGESGLPQHIFVRPKFNWKVSRGAHAGTVGSSETGPIGREYDRSKNKWHGAQLQKQLRKSPHRKVTLFVPSAISRLMAVIGLLLGAFNPLEDRPVFRRILRPAHTTPVRDGVSSCNPLALRSRYWLQQKKAFLRLGQINDVRRSVKCAVEEGMSCMAVDTRVAVFAALLEDRLYVTPEVSFIQMSLHSRLLFRPRGPPRPGRGLGRMHHFRGLGLALEFLRHRLGKGPRRPGKP